MSIKICSFCNSQGDIDRVYWQSEDGSACMCSECSLEHAKATLDILNGIAENTNACANKCSFCYTEETDRIYRHGNDQLACMCGNCCVQFARITLEKREQEGDDQSGEELLDKNDQFKDYLAALEDKWMEKNIINSYVLDAGGRINQVTFRFKDEGDEFYFVCELEVEGLEELPEDVEENILNEIEWAFDEIREDLEADGLDLDNYLGEKVILKN
jgi:hypothetical protein